MSIPENVIPMVKIPNGLTPIERKAFLRQAQIDTFEPKVDHLADLRAEEERLDALEDAVVIEAHLKSAAAPTRAALLKLEAAVFGPKVVR